MTNETDPRAALADSMVQVHPHMTQTEEFAADLIPVLAERGVLLVTEEGLAAALRTVWPGQYGEPLQGLAEDAAARIFAALSGEATK
jgi:hypothetical protein